MSESRWLVRYQPRTEAEVLLLCLPHAGGSAATFASWAARIDPRIELCAVEYPGRGMRRSEPPFVRLHGLVAAMVRDVELALDRPFAVFGHSLGALIGLEFLRLRHRHRRPAARLLAVASCRHPLVHGARQPLFRASAHALLAHLRTLNGTPDVILADERFLDLFVPVLRADLEMADTYAYQPAARLQHSIVLMSGIDTGQLASTDLVEWSRESEQPLRSRTYPGGYFFSGAAEAGLLRDLAGNVLNAVGSREPAATLTGSAIGR